MSVYLFLELLLLLDDEGVVRDDELLFLRLDDEVFFRDDEEVLRPPDELFLRLDDELFFRPPELERRDDEVRCAELPFVSPASARCLFTVAAAIS